MRIFLAAVFAALLITAGEWARRNEIAAGVTPIPSRHIPSILTAAGTVAAYATVYAAFALYGFLSPPVAFILLGLVALATLAAALLHGPALAGLGVAGAFVTPLLVPSDAPNYWALYSYLAVVTAAAFALGAHAAVALAGGHRRGARRALDAARRRLSACRVHWRRICFTSSPALRWRRR